MTRIMGIVNLTPDSFREGSRADAGSFVSRVSRMLEAGVSIIDVGAVSTRPGASFVSEDMEWTRLEPALRALKESGLFASVSSEGPVLPEAEDASRFWLSVDTFRSGIVRRVYDMFGPFIVNDISAGEDDVSMLPLVGRLGLPYVAMHKRGNPTTMDSLCSYTEGVVPALIAYFREFASKAAEAGIEDWILDPGLGFAKTPEQCLEILERLGEFKALGRPVLIGASHKRFTRSGLCMADGRVLDNVSAERLAIQNGADIIRKHFEF